MNILTRLSGKMPILSSIHVLAGFARGSSAYIMDAMVIIGMGPLYPQNYVAMGGH